MNTPRSALETATSIRDGERTATEVLEEHLETIDRLNPTLNAVCLRDDERARADAGAIDSALAKGRGSQLGAFAGVPMLIKDLNDVAGWPTSYGSRATSSEPA